METLSLLSMGFEQALTPEALLFCFIGVSLGTFIGVLPGIGSLTTIALCLPLTFHLEPLLGLIMLAGIFYGAQYGSSTASILLNVPGSAPAAITCLDGYPMSRQGRAGIALFITTIASFIGGSFAILLLIFFAVTTTFLEQSGMDLELPESSTAEATESAPIVVEISAQGEVRLSGETVTIEELERRVAAPEESERAKITLRADRQLELGLAVSVIDALRRAGAEGISLPMVPVER